MRVSFLLNWYLNPYHAPIVVAKEMGFYKESGIDLALLEPTDPSDVTEIIGRGEIPLGLKAMVHCYAARGRGLAIKALGTLLDEPPTGLISIKSKEINNLDDLRGKRLGYIGKFGKVMIDRLAKEGGMHENEYSTVRVGMDAAHAILSDQVDAAIGLSCFQQLEVEASGVESQLLRIDQLANLGCCCFCSILFITHEKFLETEKDLFSQFMQATMKGLLLTREAPEEAFRILSKFDPHLNTPLFKKIFTHSLPFFSRDLFNNERDWGKVGKYAHKLGIVGEDVHPQACYTNEFIPQSTLTSV